MISSSITDRRETWPRTLRPGPIEFTSPRFELEVRPKIAFVQTGPTVGELREAIADGKASVVERLGRMTGYTTGITYFTHSVAETNDDLQALIGAAADFGTPGFLVPLANTQLFRWSLAHNLRVFFVVNMMTIGIYQEPAGAYMPSVGY